MAESNLTCQLSERHHLKSSMAVQDNPGFIQWQQPVHNHSLWCSAESRGGGSLEPRQSATISITQMTFLLSWLLCIFMTARNGAVFHIAITLEVSTYSNHKMFRLVADLELGRLLGNFLICFPCYLYEDCAVLVICFNDSEFIDRLEVRYL